MPFNFYRDRHFVAPAMLERCANPLERCISIGECSLFDHYNKHHLGDDQRRRYVDTLKGIMRRCWWIHVQIDLVGGHVELSSAFSAHSPRQPVPPRASFNLLSFSSQLRLFQLLFKLPWPLQGDTRVFRRLVSPVTGCLIKEKPCLLPWTFLILSSRPTRWLWAESCGLVWSMLFDSI